MSEADVVMLRAELEALKSLVRVILTFSREAGEAAQAGRDPGWSELDVQTMHDAAAEACVLVGLPPLCNHDHH